VKKKYENMRTGWTEYNLDNCMEHCNIADEAFFILTGSASGITVLDFDNVDSYNELIEKFSALKDLYPVKTNKGYHIYFLYNKEYPSSVDAFTNYASVDILNDSKCVCAPPTTYRKLNGDSVLYQIIDGDIDFMPEYLINELQFKKKNKVVEEKVESKYNLTTEEKIDIINKCLSCLSSDRCDDFDEWKKVGLIMNNELGSDGYEIFDEWSSSNSDKYDRDAVKDFYERINRLEGGLTIGSLKAMAKEDDEEMYISLFKKSSKT
jgi:hypothetical protein